MRRLTYVTDPHHLEGAEEDPLIPGPGRRMARFIRSLVEFGSAIPPGATGISGVNCRRRPGRRPCAGSIVVARRVEPPELHWECPQCRDHGVIHSWQGCRWDRSRST
ncbi:MAG: hypothetical protein HY726_18870 [Candidatus Rokubacteria bacterium]|nr:hypothetical protein [Candidatus Rokubacteria bacterium]